MELARFYYQQLLDAQSDHFGALVNLGICYEGLNQPEKALACYQKAYKYKNNSYELLNNLGNCLYYLRRIDESIDFFDRAIALDPNENQAYWNKSLSLLAKGDYANGWAMYESRWKLADELVNVKIPFKQPRWTGQDINGKTILILAEQGYGDSLQFCRYIPMVAKKGAKVVIASQKGLEELLLSVEGVSKTVTDIDHLVDFDYYCPMMSLPQVFGTTLDTIPKNIPYIHADVSKMQHWQNRLAKDTQFKVGIVWAGNPRVKDIKGHLIDKRRSMSLFDLAPMFEVDGISFYSLQKGEAKQHLAVSPFKNRVIDYTDELKDFGDTAALVMQMDLIISVDTAVVHLAGALGKPVWVLSRYDGCWRWLLNRNDSPWYPTARIFTQTKPGEWRELMLKVVEQLKLQKH